MICRQTFFIISERKVVKLTIWKKSENKAKQNSKSALLWFTIKFITFIKKYDLLPTYDLDKGLQCAAALSDFEVHLDYIIDNAGYVLWCVVAPTIKLVTELWKTNNRTELQNYTSRYCTAIVGAKKYNGCLCCKCKATVFLYKIIWCQSKPFWRCEMTEIYTHWFFAGALWKTLMRFFQNWPSDH